MKKPDIRPFKEVLFCTHYREECGKVSTEQRMRCQKVCSQCKSSEMIIQWD